MSSKRSAPPTPGSSEKKRKVLSLAEKMDVLAVIDSGLGWSATGKKFGLHEATVRTIWKTRGIRASGPAEEQRGRRSHQEKARSIYDHLAEKEPSGSSLPPGLLPAMGGSIDSSSVLACTTLLAQVSPVTHLSINPERKDEELDGVHADCPGQDLSHGPWIRS
ncbi:hypothetical protein GWK47_046720 [Chionoecetes opilio]|uniref:HTH psq-type domain-containing protein n=1 Tax=Chionoecetes opilio TaxID=41210 RepID=A0A8J5CGU3_CHIOP|nr:hypothetical protein GWK47_046720 [Chionoecetes opilio]